MIDEPESNHSAAEHGSLEAPGGPMLAISLMAGEIASLFLSRPAVPVIYYLSERGRHPEEGAAS